MDEKTKTRREKKTDEKTKTRTIENKKCTVVSTFSVLTTLLSTSRSSQHAVYDILNKTQGTMQKFYIGYARSVMRSLVFGVKRCDVRRQIIDKY